jgi:hypothetical protein
MSLIKIENNKIVLPKKYEARFKEWSKALKSEDYPQSGEGELFTTFERNDNIGYCCLGVYCALDKVVKESDWKFYGNFGTDTSTLKVNLSDIMIENLPMIFLKKHKMLFQDIFSELNDSVTPDSIHVSWFKAALNFDVEVNKKYSFKEIADFIDTYITYN